MNIEKLERQIEFIIEVDKLKNIYRQNYIADKSRKENDAEHSWHLAIMALLLAEHSAHKDIDILKVMRMVLIHDIVEIDAGDTFLYDDVGNGDKRIREEKAAEKIFGILPKEQKDELIGLWEEFEARESPESQFAASLDGLHPLINNYITEGEGWKKHKVKVEKVLEKKEYIKNGSPLLWEYAKKIIKECGEKGYLVKD